MPDHINYTKIFGILAILAFEAFVVYMVPDSESKEKQKQK